MALASCQTMLAENGLDIDSKSGSIVSDSPYILAWTVPLGNREKKRTVYHQDTVSGRHGKGVGWVRGKRYRGEEGFSVFGTLLLASESICSAYAWQVFSFLLPAFGSYKSIFNALTIISYTLHESFSLCARLRLAFFQRSANYSCCCTLSNLSFQ